MPFFLHPHPDRVLRAAGDGERDPVLARDYFMRRLAEIGVS